MSKTFQEAVTDWEEDWDDLFSEKIALDSDDATDRIQKVRKLNKNAMVSNMHHAFTSEWFIEDDTAGVNKSEYLVSGNSFYMNRRGSRVRL